MLVRDKLTDDITVVGLSHFYATNFIFFGSVGVSSGTLISAENISLRLILPMQEWTLQLPEFKETDIIHLLDKSRYAFVERNT